MRADLFLETMQTRNKGNHESVERYVGAALELST